jgi:hypothetical protein
VSGYVGPYNNVRLNSAVGYIMPKDRLARRQAARKQRQNRRQQAA